MGCPLLRLALLVLLAPRGRAWDSGDLELFDLVEEVPRNFYDFLGVQQVSAAPRPAALLERDPGAPRGSNAAGSPPPLPAPDSRAASGAVTARRCPARPRRLRPPQPCPRRLLLRRRSCLRAGRLSDSRLRAPCAPPFLASRRSARLPLL